MRFPVTLLAALLVLAGCSATTSDPETAAPSSNSESMSTTSPTAETGPPTTAADGAQVVEVVDGDTISVEVDGQEEPVRVIGINAPERGECLAEEATDRLQDLVAGQDVELVTDETDRDQYGRLLRHVEVSGTDVGAVRFDADGDDNQNLNDEWVRIANQGSSPVDLTGWVLKDTSATHRYGFPNGFSLEPGASVTVRTGCGTDSPTDLHWCNEGSAVWNNSGDTAFLLDPAGNIVASRDG